MKGLDNIRYELISTTRERDGDVRRRRNGNRILLSQRKNCVTVGYSLTAEWWNKLLPT